MIEAQLNIYHHFCSQTVAWGPDQLEGHVLLSQPEMSPGYTTLAPTPTAWLCLLRAITHHAMAEVRKGPCRVDSAESTGVDK